MAPLETIEAVPIARVGVWETTTGRWVCTREQLDDAVRASKDPAFRRGVIKLGHLDPRFAPKPGHDGTPAVGRLDNLRVDASGDVLLADLVGVPAWLKKVLNSAYPSRSVEASMGVVTDAGQTYGLVVTGLALLGETPPAIESLADVAALYEQPTEVDAWIAASRIAASIDTTAAGHAPPAPPRTGILASATIDELVAQATAYASGNGVAYPWVREVLTDRVILSSDEAPRGQLWELGWTEGGDGTFTFDGPHPVKIEYTRLAASGGQRVVHEAIVPLRYVRGRGDVSASTPEEHPPVSDLARQVRERLGLPPDATDEQVTAALDARLGTQGDPAGTQPATNGQTAQPATNGDGNGQAAGPTTVPAEGQAQGQQGQQAPQGGQQAQTGGQAGQAQPPAGPQNSTGADAGGGQSGQGGQVSAAALERLINERIEAATAPLRQSLAETSTELAARKERERVAHRDALLASAVRTGRITPASIEGDRGWRAQYDASPAGAAAVESVMASLADGAAVPVGALGVPSPPEPSGDGFTDAEYASLFPDERRTGAAS
jgi:hypothetical protein